MLETDDITAVIVDSALKVHRNLGPGLLESVYEAVLARELVRRGLSVARQFPVRIDYNGELFDEVFRVDLFVEAQVPVELKSVERLARVHGKQVLTHLRLMKLPVGLLINFGGATLKEGLCRIVNQFPANSSSRLRVNRFGPDSP